MPSLFRFLTVVGVLGGLTYGAMFVLATWFDPKPREITVSIPPDRFAKQPKRAHAPMARAGRNFRRSADRAVPRHARGRARRRREHACRLCAATSPTSPRILGAARRASPSASTDDVRGYLAIARQARLCGRLGGAAALRDPPALSLPLCGGTARDDPAAVIEGPEARPRAAEGAQHRRGRSPARAGARRHGERRGSARAASGFAPRGSLACSNCSTPPDCGSPSWSRCRSRRPSATRACSWCAARAARSGWCRSTRPPRRAMARVSRAAAREAEPQAGTIEMAVPLLRRERPPHPPAFCPRTEGARRGRRAARRAGEPACAAPRLRQPPPAQRRRPAGGADAARPRRHLDHTNLHPRAGGAAQEPGARPASAGRGLTYAARHDLA